MPFLPGDIVENTAPLISDRNKIAQKGRKFRVIATDGKTVCLLIPKDEEPSLKSEIYYARSDQIKLIGASPGDIEVIKLR